ncbi:MAG: hypothetical protein WC556_10575 [Candidatus Methanoperedens sp.]
MSILDVTEDQIFQTLGKGKDPNFKPIEKVRPVTIKPKKTYTINTNSRNINSKIMPAVKPVKPVEAPVQQVVITAPATQADETVKKLTEDLNELNNRVYGLQKMVKWYMVPQFVVVLVLILVLVVKANT